MLVMWAHCLLTEELTFGIRQILFLLSLALEAAQQRDPDLHPAGAFLRGNLLTSLRESSILCFKTTDAILYAIIPLLGLMTPDMGNGNSFQTKAFLQLWPHSSLSFPCLFVCFTVWSTEMWTLGSCCPASQMLGRWTSASMLSLLFSQFAGKSVHFSQEAVGFLCLCHACCM